MNIFLTDPDPVCCAQALDNRRLVKMVLETAQLLSTACSMLLVDDDRLYKKTHYNHPCSVFARKTHANFNWLVEHGLALSREYQHRYYKVHASEEIILIAYEVMAKAVRDGLGITHGRPEGLTFSFNCSGFDTGDIFHDYRLCMTKKWQTDTLPPKFSRRGKPLWV